jgi:hypothetical protein
MSNSSHEAVSNSRASSHRTAPRCFETDSHSERPAAGDLPGHGTWIWAAAGHSSGGPRCLDYVRFPPIGQRTR